MRAEIRDVVAAHVEVMLDESLRDSLSEVAQDFREKIRAELPWFGTFNVTPYTVNTLQKRLVTGDDDERVRILGPDSSQKALFENESWCEMVCG
jgi:hypothetical protein